MSPSGGDWLSVYRAVFDHPKAKRLAKRLGMAVPAAVGHLICLWTWCMTIAPDGDLSRFDPEDIEAAAGWGGEDGLFVVAATECRWLDDTGSGLVIHDWADWAGTLVTRRANERQRSADRRSTAGRPAVDQRSAGQTAITDKTERTVSTEKTVRTEELCPPEDQPDVLCGEIVSSSTTNGDGFEAFWSDYPRKETRSRAAGLWKHMKTADQARALAACRHYATWAARHPDEKLQLPSTFLSKTGRRWEEWEHGPPPGRDRAPARSARAVDSAFGAIGALYGELEES